MSLNFISFSIFQGKSNSIIKKKTFPIKKSKREHSFIEERYCIVNWTSYRALTSKLLQREMQIRTNLFRLIWTYTVDKYSQRILNILS